MARIRSPNYPQLSLPEAIARVGMVFSKERKHPAPKEVVIGHIGYGSINGASLGALSALVKYGLLDRDGENYRVSDRAVSILHPSSDEDKNQALRAAASAPALFAEILDSFKGEIPSDANLRAYLVRRGFAESAIEPVIAKLRETIELVAPIVPPVHTRSEPTQAVGATMHSAGSVMPPGRGDSQPTLQNQRVLNAPWRVSLTELGLEVTANITDQKGVERLIGILQANKTLLPQTGESPAVAADTAPMSNKSEDDAVN